MTFFKNPKKCFFIDPSGTYISSLKRIGKKLRPLASGHHHTDKQTNRQTNKQTDKQTDNMHASLWEKKEKSDHITNVNVRLRR